MGTDVDQRIGFDRMAQPKIKRDIAMAWNTGEVVVIVLTYIALASFWLQRDQRRAPAGGGKV